jgi:hypothetical protein
MSARTEVYVSRSRSVSTSPYSTATRVELRVFRGSLIAIRPFNVTSARSFGRDEIYARVNPRCEGRSRQSRVTGIRTSVASLSARD